MPKIIYTWFRQIQAFPTKRGLDICIFVDPKDTQLEGSKSQRHDMGMKKRPLKGGIADTPLKMGQGPGGGSGCPLYELYIYSPFLIAILRIASKKN